MHRILLIASLLAALLVAPVSAHAQDGHITPEWTIQVDPLTFALGFAHVQVEWAFSEYVSVYAGPSLKLWRGPTEDEEQSPYPYLGLGAEVGVRWFFLGGAPEGWWAQIRGVLAHLSTEVDGEELTDIGGYVSALAGYTAIFGGWFVLSGGLGVQYIHYTVGPTGLKGVLPAAHTTIGVAF